MIAQKFFHANISANILNVLLLLVLAEIINETLQFGIFPNLLKITIGKYAQGIKLTDIVEVKEKNYYRLLNSSWYYLNVGMVFLRQHFSTWKFMLIIGNKKGMWRTVLVYEKI